MRLLSRLHNHGHFGLVMGVGGILSVLGVVGHEDESASPELSTSLSQAKGEFDDWKKSKEGELKADLLMIVEQMEHTLEQMTSIKDYKTDEFIQLVDMFENNLLVLHYNSGQVKLPKVFQDRSNIVTESIEEFYSTEDGVWPPYILWKNMRLVDESTEMSAAIGFDQFKQWVLEHEAVPDSKELPAETLQMIEQFYQAASPTVEVKFLDALRKTDVELMATLDKGPVANLTTSLVSTLRDFPGFSRSIKWIAKIQKLQNDVSARKIAKQSTDDMVAKLEILLKDMIGHFKKGTIPSSSYSALISLFHKLRVQLEVHYFDWCRILVNPSVKTGAGIDAEWALELKKLGTEICGVVDQIQELDRIITASPKGKKTVAESTPEQRLDSRVDTTISLALREFHDEIKQYYKRTVGADAHPEDATAATKLNVNQQMNKLWREKMVPYLEKDLTEEQMVGFVRTYLIIEMMNRHDAFEECDICHDSPLRNLYKKISWVFFLPAEMLEKRPVVKNILDHLALGHQGFSRHLQIHDYFALMRFNYQEKRWTDSNPSQPGQGVVLFRLEQLHSALKSPHVALGTVTPHIFNKLQENVDPENLTKDEMDMYTIAMDILSVAERLPFIFHANKLNEPSNYLSLDETGIKEYLQRLDENLTRCASEFMLIQKNSSANYHEFFNKMMVVVILPMIASLHTVMQTSVDIAASQENKDGDISNLVEELEVVSRNFKDTLETIFSAFTDEQKNLAGDVFSSVSDSLTLLEPTTPQLTVSKSIQEERTEMDLEKSGLKRGLSFRGRKQRRQDAVSKASMDLLQRVAQTHVSSPDLHDEAEGTVEADRRDVTDRIVEAENKLAELEKQLTFKEETLEQTSMSVKQQEEETKKLSEKINHLKEQIDQLNAIQEEEKSNLEELARKQTDAAKTQDEANQHLAETQSKIANLQQQETELDATHKKKIKDAEAQAKKIIADAQTEQERRLQEISQAAQTTADEKDPTAEDLPLYKQPVYITGAIGATTTLMALAFGLLSLFNVIHLPNQQENVMPRSRQSQHLVYSNVSQAGYGQSETDPNSHSF